MRKRLYVLGLVLLVVAMGMLASACGDDATETTAAGTETTAAATGEPIKIGLDMGFTGFMAYDVSLAEKGALTALAMLDNQVMGRPLEFAKADHGSDVSIAVDKARQLVESDGVPIIIGPMFTPATAAVTDFLGK